MTATIILPVRNGGACLLRIFAALDCQSLKPTQLIATDTASVDDSKRLLEAAGFHVLDVQPGEFRHGATRNRAARMARSDVLVFLTQDAVPQGPEWLEELIRPIQSGDAVASYARQIPDEHANPMERFSRTWNYPAEGSLARTKSAPNGVRSYFFSNSSSAILRTAFDDLGGFPEHTIMNEDMLFAARLRGAGFRLAYVPQAIVEHSHDYGVWQTFKRYFDIGVVFKQGRADLARVRTTGEGLRYVGGLFTYLWQAGHYSWLATAMVESIAKWVGIFLGQRYDLLPRSLVRSLSMHRDYWNGRT